MLTEEQQAMLWAAVEKMEESNQRTYALLDELRASAQRLAATALALVSAYQDGSGKPAATTLTPSSSSSSTTPEKISGVAPITTNSMSTTTSLVALVPSPTSDPPHDAAPATSIATTGTPAGDAHQVFDAGPISGHLHSGICGHVLGLSPTASLVATQASPTSASPRDVVLAVFTDSSQNAAANHTKCSEPGVNMGICVLAPVMFKEVVSLEVLNKLNMPVTTKRSTPSSARYFSYIPTATVPMLEMCMSDVAKQRPAPWPSFNYCQAQVQLIAASIDGILTIACQMMNSTSRILFHIGQPSNYLQSVEPLSHMVLDGCIRKRRDFILLNSSWFRKEQTSKMPKPPWLFCAGRCLHRCGIFAEFSGSEDTYWAAHVINYVKALEQTQIQSSACRFFKYQYDQSLVINLAYMVRIQDSEQPRSAYEEFALSRLAFLNWCMIQSVPAQYVWWCLIVLTTLPVREVYDLWDPGDTHTAVPSCENSVPQTFGCHKISKTGSGGRPMSGQQPKKRTYKTSSSSLKSKRIRCSCHVDCYQDKNRNDICDNFLSISNKPEHEGSMHLIPEELSTPIRVANIDVKQETPDGHGEVICFNIYSGNSDAEADFGNGKTCIWVDELDNDLCLKDKSNFTYQLECPIAQTQLGGCVLYAHEEQGGVGLNLQDLTRQTLQTSYDVQDDEYQGWRQTGQWSTLPARTNNLSRSNSRARQLGVKLAVKGGRMSAAPSQEALERMLKQGSLKQREDLA